MAANRLCPIEVISTEATLKEGQELLYLLILIACVLRFFSLDEALVIILVIEITVLLHELTAPLIDCRVDDAQSSETEEKATYLNSPFRQCPQTLSCRNRPLPLSYAALVPNAVLLQIKSSKE